jgi:simple sugar transport system permease protein
MSQVSDTAERSPETIGAAPTGRNRGSTVLSRAGALFLKQREASILLVAIVLFIYFTVTTPAFFSHGSFVNIAEYMAPYVIIGIGLVLLMVCGEIDLSVGFVWLLAPYVMHFFVDSGIPTILAIVITVLLLSVVGVVNGVVTTLFGVPSLITTLATGYIIYGYALTVSAAQQINLPAQSLGVGRWFGAEAWSEFIWATVLVLIFQVLLTRTRWGLYTVAVGGNMLGAKESGIKVNRIKIGNFMMCSSLAALAGILEAFKNDIIDPSAGGLPVLLVALAGVVIGGTAMMGGSGTMIGLWLGMLVLGILQDGFNLRGISSNEYLIILGAAILLAMIGNTQLTRLRSAGRLQRSGDTPAKRGQGGGVVIGQITKL